MKPSLVIVGLGNPGASYDGTRHNIGFEAIDLLSDEYGTGEWKESGKFNALVQEARIVTAPVLLVKPQTFMNLSANAVRPIVDFYKLDPESQVLTMFDDIDLPLNSLRLRIAGSAGTHNGLKSIVEQFGQNTPRLRIGIGPKREGADLSTWVLSKFAPEEREAITTTLKRIPTIVRDFVLDGTTVEQ